MFRWRVEAGPYIIDEGDWGRDVVSTVGETKIDKLILISENEKVTVYPQNGVIKVDNKRIALGVSVDGYPYQYEDECFFEIVQVSPFTVAEYSMDTKKSTKLDRHLFLKYKVTHLIDKVSRKKTKLPVPLIKTHIIRCGGDLGVSIC